MVAGMRRGLILLVSLLVACSSKNDRAPAPTTSAPALTTSAAQGSAPATAAGSSVDPWALAPRRASTADPAKVAAFWKWFEANAKTLREDSDIEATMLSINAEVQKIDADVFAEVGR